MKKFQFRLERVADLRRRQEDACRRRHADSLLRLASEQSVLDALLKAVDESHAEKIGAEPQDRLLLERRIALLRERLIQQRERVRVSAEAAEQRRLERVAAGRETLKFQRLRARQELRHELARAAAEGREMDETARIQDGLKRAHAA